MSSLFPFYFIVIFLFPFWLNSSQTSEWLSIFFVPVHKFNFNNILEHQFPIARAPIRWCWVRNQKTWDRQGSEGILFVPVTLG